MARTADPENEARRRQQIIWSCYTLLAKMPHHEVTFERIAQESGLSRGLVHYYFGSKDQLIVTTIETFMARQADWFEAIAGSEATIDERIEQFIDAVVPAREVIEERARFIAEVWSFAKSSPETTATVRRAYQRLNEGLDALLARAAGKKKLRDRSAVLETAALLEGLCLQIIYDPELDVDAIRALAHERLVEWLGLRGARSKR